MRRKLVAGNWKMNGNAEFAKDFSSSLRSKMAGSSLACDVMIAPPVPYLCVLSEALSGADVKLAAQNVAEYEEGAYTGEVSATMLANVGCSMALVGHSERRTLYGETDLVVLQKTRQLLANDLTAVVCIGETLEERKAGREEAVVSQQLALLIEQLSVNEWDRIILAYEPVWAIGTGETATPEQAQAIHAFIRGQLQQVSAAVAEKTRILYGGSVKAANAAELFAQPDIDGGLVGGASLDANEFTGICQA